jgi:hypothetical protein
VKYGASSSFTSSCRSAGDRAERIRKEHEKRIRREENGGEKLQATTKK